MKQLLIIASTLFYAFTGFGQSAQYEASMTELTFAIQNSHNGGLLAHANSMERIAAAESKEWLPQYWVAYCLINETYTISETAKKEQLLEKAKVFLEKAEELNPNNTEVEVMKANYAQAMLAIDPMSRWEKYGAEFQNALGRAEKIDAQNPRIAYLMGTNIFYTPEGFGGGKKNAKPRFVQAKALFAKQTVAKPYAPSWGMAETDYFLKQCE